MNESATIGTLDVGRNEGGRQLLLPFVGTEKRGTISSPGTLQGG